MWRKRKFLFIMHGIKKVNKVEFDNNRQETQALAGEIYKYDWGESAT